jgi:aldose 1-epimerase
MKKFTSLFILLIGFFSCTPQNKKTIQIEKDSYGITQEGQEVDRYTLSNAAGMQVEIITYGGIITSMKVPNAAGGLNDVVLGYDSLSDYEKGSPYFGALIGRYGNRIADGSFTLDDQTYTLVQNDEKITYMEEQKDLIKWFGAPILKSRTIKPYYNFTT